MYPGGVRGCSEGKRDYHPGIGGKKYNRRRRNKGPRRTGWQTLDIVPLVSFVAVRSIATPVLTDLELITSTESGTGF